VVLGYAPYLDPVRSLLDGKTVLGSGMTKELDRAGQALDQALQGNRTALVSGGDPGIYAMAGVVFDLARARGIPLTKQEDGQGIPTRVIPGVPALAAAAALLGAPLMHDFCAISLSDRLTPWDLIERRLILAAEADFVIVLYNPKSHGRDWQFGRAMECLSAIRTPETPVGVVRQASREGESAVVTTLALAPQAEVDMRTVVVVGSSQTYAWNGWMVTPRGYLEKYGADR
jgi:precorrin-3B C17-methyltransferase